MSARRRPVVVLGGFGQVGQALAATAPDDEPGPVLLGRDEADVEDREGVRTVLRGQRPRAVVNCTVFQPVDLCETKPARAFAVNATAAGVVARECRDVGARLVHLSTDYVFDGECESGYDESHCPRPLGVYAASKLAGEYLVLAASPTNMVVRTSALYGRPAPGHGSTCFVERMLERALSGQETRIVRDQANCPTRALELAETMWRLLECGGTGVFHVAGRGTASWFEVAAEVFNAAGARKLLSPTLAAEIGAPARRPRNSTLISSRLRDLGIEEHRPWREAIREHLNERGVESR